MKFLNELKSLLSFLVCFFLLAVIFVCLFCRTTYKKEYKYLDGETQTVVEVKDYYEYFKNNFYYRCKLMEFNKEIKGEKKNDNEVDVLFLGDERYELMNDSRLYQGYNTLNQGIKADTTRGALSRLEYVYKVNPKAVVIQIGFNDIVNENRETEYIVKSYTTLVEELKENLPNTLIVIESVYPTSGSNMYTIATINNQIIELNAKLSELASNNNCEFVNEFDLLKDENNEIEYKFSTDGTTITDTGYIVMSKQVLEVLDAKLK